MLSSWKVVSLFGLAFALCFLSLTNPFYFDDYILIRDNAWLTGKSNPWIWFTQYYLDSNRLFPGFRPVLMTSFWLGQKIFGSSETLLHMGNILIHMGNGFLFFQLLKKIKFDRIGAYASAFAVIIFLIHPTQTLPINFIWKRSSLLEVFFTLSGLLLLIESRRGKQNIAMILFHVLFLLLSFGSKESGAMYPMWLLLFDILFFKEQLKNDKLGSGVLYSILFAAATLLILFRLHFVDQWIGHHRKIVQDVRSVGRMDYLLWSIAEVPRMILHFVLPSPRVLDDPVFSKETPWEGFLTMASLGLLTIASLFKWKDVPIATFSIATLWISFAPTNTLFPLYFVSDQIRLYFPMLGFACLLSFFLHRLREKRKTFASMLMLMTILIYAVMFGAQNYRYKTPQLIWQDVLDEYPNSGLAWGELGGTLQAQKRYGEASVAFLLASKYEKTKPGYLVRALDNMLKSNADKRQILGLLETLDLGNMSISDVVNLSLVLIQVDEMDRAEKLLKYAIFKNPSFFPAYQKLGVLYELKHEFHRSKEMYEKSLQLHPLDTFSNERLKLINRAHTN